MRPPRSIGAIIALAAFFALPLGGCSRSMELNAAGSIHNQVRFSFCDTCPTSTDKIGHFIVYEVTGVTETAATLNPIWRLQGDTRVNEIFYGHTPLGLRPPKGAHGYIDGAPPPPLVPGRSYLAYAYAATTPPADAMVYFQIAWDGEVLLPELDTRLYSKLVRALGQSFSQGHAQLDTSYDSAR